MDQSFRGAPAMGRRAFLQSTTAGVAMAAAGGAPAWAQGTPWADVPKGKVDKLNFVVWTYGDIYTKIAERFKTDWGVPVDATNTLGVSASTSAIGPCFISAAG